MPQLAPIELELPGSVTVTLNPSGFNGERAVFVDAASVPLAEKQRLTVRVRPAAKGNTGHLVEANFVSPNAQPVIDGCCPATSDAVPVSSFNLRFIRNTFASDAQATKLYDELVAYVQSDDFKSLVMGSSYY